MIPEIGAEKFEAILRKCTALITYTPRHDEIDYRKWPPLERLLPHTFTLPQNGTVDPAHWAQKCTTLFKDEFPCIVVPGTHFDIYGTRLGRGGGWYDRFLSQVPRTWLRIGMCDTTKFSETMLERKSWDEPVGWIVVLDAAISSWCVHEARPPQQ